MFDYVSCNDFNRIPSQIPNIVSNIFNGIKIVIPIILIIMCMIDLAKSITKNDNFELKEVFSLIKSKLILCVIIFLVPSLVQFVVSFSGENSVWNCVDCFLNGTKNCKEDSHDNQDNNEVITMQVGEKIDLKEKNRDYDFWLSSDTSLATVYDGFVTALLPGDVKITTQSNNEEIKYYIKIIDNSSQVDVTKIRIDNKITKVNVGENIKLNVSYEPTNATNKNFIYDSSDETIIDIDVNGNMFIKNEGKAVITVTANNGIKTSKTFISVKEDSDIELKSLKFKNKEILIDLVELDENMNFKSKEYQLEITKNPSNSSNKISYSILDSSIATIDSNGKITAIKQGETTVVVLSDNGIKLEIPLKVVELATNDTLYSLIYKKFINELNSNSDKVKVIEQLGINKIKINIKTKAYLNNDDELSYYSAYYKPEVEKLPLDITNYKYNISTCETKEQTEIVRAYLSKIATKVTRECNNSSDIEYCKLVQIRNWITKNMIYGKIENEEGIMAGSCAYNTIYKRKIADGYVGVCHAYSSIFYIMSNAVGVRTKMVPGRGHVYNISLVNGKWYYSDITWDDVSINKTTDNYYYKDKYLLFGENQLKQTHSNHIYDETLVDEIDGYLVSKENYKN